MALHDLLSEAEFAQQRGVSLLTVQRERRRRQGPNFIKLGRKFFYRSVSVESWLQSVEVQVSQISDA